MKLAKKLIAFALSLVLLLGLAVPAFADEPAFTVAADKKMVATGESITLTAVNVPQAQEGQTVEYQWYFQCYVGDNRALPLGTTADATIQAQAPGRDVATAYDPFSQKFPIFYWCVAEFSDASGLVWTKTSSKIEVVGYYNLGDSFAVPYEHIGRSFFLALVVPSLFFENIACLFGILWSPWVAVANADEAKRVNG